MNLWRNQLQSLYYFDSQNISWIIATKSFNFSEISLAVTNNDTACHLFRSALLKFWLTRVSLDGRAPENEKLSP